MNNYLFLTNEGYTYQPDSESIEPDCENSQLIGISSGNTQEEAGGGEKDYGRGQTFGVRKVQRTS